MHILQNCSILFLFHFIFFYLKFFLTNELTVIEINWKSQCYIATLGMGIVLEFCLHFFFMPFCGSKLPKYIFWPALDSMKFLCDSYYCLQGDISQGKRWELCYLAVLYMYMCIMLWFILLSVRADFLYNFLFIVNLKHVTAMKTLNKID